jgi:hypothetical protein
MQKPILLKSNPEENKSIRAAKNWKFHQQLAIPLFLIRIDSKARLPEHHPTA